MGKIIAVTNQKGGVGKTTTAVNLTAALGAKGKKVLLVDVDPQGNATSGLGINKREIQSSAYDVLLGNAKAQEAVLHTPFQNVDILPGSMDLAAAEIEMVELPEHPFYIAAQFHPEFKSRPNRSHPLFSGLVAAALAQKGD